MTMPTFLVIGANKAGTSSLYHYLGQHPEIYMSPIKEPMFFSHIGRKPEKSDNPTYQKGFMNATYSIEDYQALFKGRVNEKAVGEASTSYLHCPWTAQHVQGYVPEVKLIAILRNPVERAYSNYLMYLRMGFETLSFPEAVRAEKQRIQENFPMGWYYVKLGFYSELLRPYFDLFDPSQIKIFLYEDFQTNPDGLVKDIFQFIGVDNDFAPDMSVRHNQAPKKHKKSSPLSDEMRQGLIEVYRGDIEKTQDLIQRDLSTWLEVNKKSKRSQPSPSVADREAQVTRLEQQLARKDARIARLEQELTAIKQTKAWRLATKWYALKSYLLQYKGS